MRCACGVCTPHILVSSGYKHIKITKKFSPPFKIHLYLNNISKTLIQQ